MLDYERIADLLKAVNYNGCISIVYEGDEPEERSVLIGEAAVHLRDVFAD